MKEPSNLRSCRRFDRGLSLELRAKPGDSLQEGLTVIRSAREDLKGLHGQRANTKDVLHSGDISGLRQVLLIGENKQGLIMLDGGPARGASVEVRELLSGELHALGVGGIDDKDDGISVTRVLTPKGAHLVEAADVPTLELEPVGVDGLMVDTESGDCLETLPEDELIEDGGCTCAVEPEDEDTTRGVVVKVTGRVAAAHFWGFVRFCG